MRIQKHSPVSARAEPVHTPRVASTLTTSGSFELWSGSISRRSSTPPRAARASRSASASGPSVARSSAASAALRRFACAYATAPVRATGWNTSTSTTSRIPPTTRGRTTFQNPRFEPDTAGRYPGARGLTCPFTEPGGIVASPVIAAHGPRAPPAPSEEVLHAAFEVRVPPTGLARGGPAPARRTRRRGQGAGRRAEPDPRDETAAGGARPPGRHRPARAGHDRRGRRQPRDRRPRTPPRPRTIGTPEGPIPGDGPRGAADLRPDRPQPRHDRRFAVPRRPRGRLGFGDARVAGLRGAARGAGRTAAADLRVLPGHLHDRARTRRDPDGGPGAAAGRATRRDLPEAPT